MCTYVKMAISAIFRSFTFFLFFSFTLGSSPDCDEDCLILPFTENNPKPTFFLPDACFPLHYNLELQPFLPPNGNSSFAGNVKILIRCEIPTSSITLHSYNLDIFEPTVNVINNTDRSSIPVTRVEYDINKEFVVIHLNRKLQPKDEYNISMQYLGRLNGPNYGFYESSYVDDVNSAPKYLAMTRFKPTGARWAFPCFDEPHLKATFDVILVHPSFLKAVSNMPSHHIESRAGGLTADFFITSEPMSTYMVFCAVSDFSYKEGGGRIKNKIWSRNSTSQFRDTASGTVMTAITYFEDYFKITYPFNHTVLIAVPDFGPDVLESGQLVTMREDTSLYRDPVTSYFARQRIYLGISHGLAHWWFGNLVTMNWWNDLWLIEGFAIYFADFGADKHSPECKIPDQFYALHTMSALQDDCSEFSRALSSSVLCMPDLQFKFKRITNHKGAALIRMMKYFLGESVLYRGVRNYLINNVYLTTVQDDLWYYLEQATTTSLKFSVKKIMDTWTLQKGYPVVTILRDYVTHTATVSQTYFSLAGTTENVKSNQYWHIPLTFTTQANPNFNDTKTKFWLQNNGENVTLKMENGVPLIDQWMIFNIQVVTYCVVNYDQQNWNLLSSYIKRNQTQDYGFINMAQLIHDSFILARGGLLNYAIPLQLSHNILLKEPVAYLSWDAFHIAANQLSSLLKLTEIYPQWNKYIIQIVTTTVDKKDDKWNAVPNTHLPNLALQICSELAIKAGRNETIAQAVELYNKYIRGNLTIHHDALKVACWAAILRGGDTEFNTILSWYLTATWPSDKPRFLSYLATVTNKDHLRILLNLALNSTSAFRERDFNQLFSIIVTSSEDGRDEAIRFVRTKLQEIKTRFGTNTKLRIKFMLMELARSFTSANDLAKMKELIPFVKSELKYDDEFKSVYKTINANIRWMQNGYEQVKTFLQNHISL